MDRAKIVPTSWFFTMCYRVTSRIMSANNREKFQMLKLDELAIKLFPILSKEILPAHLGGNSSTYSTVVYLDFDPNESLFPITVKLKK